MSFFPAKDTCDPSEDPALQPGTCDPSEAPEWVGILNKSDVYAGIVSIMQNYIGASYGGAGLFMPAVMATAISAASRALTAYGVGFGGEDSYLPITQKGLNNTTSNLLFVGIFNAVIAMLMKRNVPRQTFYGMEIDSLGYTLMQNTPWMSPKDTIIFGYKK